MSEAAGIALLAIAGILLMAAFTRLSVLTLVTLGPIVGLCSYVLTGTILVIIAGYMVPTVTLGASATILGAIAIGRRRRPDRRTLAAVAMVVVAIAGVAAVTLTLSPTRLTPDSLQVIAVADLITEPGGLDEVPQTMLLKRNLTAPLLQTLGSLDGRPYATTVMPVLVMAGFSTLALAIWTALSDTGQTRRRLIVMVGSAIVFAVFSNRPLYDAFYVNSHGAVMTAFLVVVAGGFLARRRRGWLLAVAVAAAVIVPARPEGMVVVALGLLPIITASDLKPLERVLVTVPASLTAVVWFGIGLWSRAPGERSLDPTDPVAGGLFIGIALVAVAAMAGHRLVAPWVQWSPWLAVGALTALLARGYRADPDILLVSVTATAANLVGEGFWGVSWILVAAMTAGAFFSNGFEGDRLFILPIAGFSVMFWVLPYLREGPYRVGAGDSGNRVLAHLFLVAVAYVAIAAGRAEPEQTGPPELSGRREHHEPVP